MDGNSAKKAPVLDHLVDTKSNHTVTSTPTPAKQQTCQDNKAVVTPMNGVQQPIKNPQPQAQTEQKNRRTDKSEFEIELTKTVNRIMLKHFEDASEEIVSQVLREVRSRLPGRRKD